MCARVSERMRDWVNERENVIREWERAIDIHYYRTGLPCCCMMGV